MNITFVVESKNLWKSDKSGHRRAKWSWLTTIDEESGSDVDPTETDAESGSEASSSAREASEATSEDELNDGDSSAESMSSESSTGESDKEDENFEQPKRKARPSKKANRQSSKIKLRQAKRGPSKSKSRTRKTKETNSLTQDELEDLCFELGERRGDLLNFTKLKNLKYRRH